MAKKGGGFEERVVHGPASVKNRQLAVSSRLFRQPFANKRGDIFPCDVKKDVTSRETELAGYRLFCFNTDDRK